MTTFHLFAYGTLRGDGDASDVLEGCTLRGPATIAGMLYDIDGRFPALVLYGDAPVQGDVWECPASLLLRLDEYEDVRGGLFRRVAIEVSMDDGAVLPCWIYAAGPALAHKLLPEARLPEGVWTSPGGVLRR